MKLIIDAGASSTDCAIVSDQVLKSWKLGGINPTSNPDSVHQINLILSEINPEDLEFVYYYGAGVRPDSLQKIYNVFNEELPKTQIHIENDMQGAALCFHQEEKHIVGILGTGSNFALYEGVNALINVPSPGYLFGDYGSGFALGKYILESYLYQNMEVEEAEQFEHVYQNKLISMVSDLYYDQRPNFKVANYVKYLDHSSIDFRRKALKYCFDKMINERIMKIPNSTAYKLSFIGSIAYLFKDELEAACSAHGYKVGKIVKTPIKGLIEYHIAND